MDKKRIEELSKRPFGLIFPKAIEDIKKNLCPTCGKKIEGFKNSISHKEYRISGMCQECQDMVFK